MDVKKRALTAVQQLKVAKHITPLTFENATPQFHIDILNFMNCDKQYKAAAIFRGAAKTTLLNRVNIFCRIFFEQEPFVLVCSDSADKAMNFLEEIKFMIDEANKKGYAIQRGSTWTKEEISVVVNKGKKDENGNSLESECCVVSISVGKSPRGFIKKGRRPTLIICDDMESNQGQFAASSASNRKKVEKYFYVDLMPSLHPIRGKLIVIGTIIHVDSLLNNIITQKEPDKKDGEEEAYGRVHRDDWGIKVYAIMENGVPLWNSRFPLEYIEQKKSMLSQRGLENEFYQEYMCKPLSPDKQIFKRENFNYYDTLEYAKIIPTISMRDALNQKEIRCPIPTHIIKGDKKICLSSCHIYTTMDLASYDGADRSAIITFALARDNNIYILDISCGHFTPFEKSIEALRVQTSFNPVSFGIEKASAQNDFFYTIQAAQKETGIKINIVPLSHHSRSKNIRIMQLQPMFITNRIYFNKKQSAVIELEAELLGFNPEVESKHDDIIDALAYIVEFLGSRDMMEEFSDADEQYVYENDESYF